MMRPFEVSDIYFDEEPLPPPKLIRPPRKKSKLKSWRSYYRWWVRQQYWEIWWNCDSSQPWKVVNF